jgi:hypothetical protein
MEVKKLVCVQENLAEIQQRLAARVGSLSSLSLASPIPAGPGTGSGVPDQQ